MNFNVNGDRSRFSTLTSLTSSCSPFEHSSLTSVDPEDSSDGRGDIRTDPSIDSFLEIGSEIEVLLAPITASSSTSPSPLKDSRKMFSLLHLLTLWRMNLVISRSGKFVWQFPQIRRSFSCSRDSRLIRCCGRPCFRRDMTVSSSYILLLSYCLDKSNNKDGGSESHFHVKSQFLFPPGQFWSPGSVYPSVRL